jgi:succinate dehydrogenase / fumarate reductase flavoprotein subunit
MRAERLPTLGVSTQVRAYNKEWIESLEVENLLLVLELSARAALEREESRGVHFREDHPITDNDRWLREIVMSPNGEGVHVEHRPIRAATLPPPNGTLPHLEMIRNMMRAHSDVGGHH